MTANPMTLRDYIENNFTHVTLCTEMVGQNGSIVKIPELNRDLTVGLISTDSKDEFEKLCFTFVPVGTIIDHLDDKWYEAKVLRVRQLLTKMMLDEKSRSIAQKYFDTLERRDRVRWAKESKAVEVTQTDPVNAKSTTITFKVVD